MPWQLKVLLMIFGLQFCKSKSIMYYNNHLSKLCVLHQLVLRLVLSVRRVMKMINVYEGKGEREIRSGDRQWEWEKWTNEQITEWMKEGRKPYPESSPLLSSQENTGRSHQWGCRCRCWCRGRSRHKLSRTCHLDRLQNRKKQHTTLRINKKTALPLLRLEKPINIMTLNLGTLLWTHLWKHTDFLKRLCKHVPLMDDILLFEWTRNDLLKQKEESVTASCGTTAPFTLLRVEWVMCQRIKIDHVHRPLYTFLMKLIFQCIQALFNKKYYFQWNLVCVSLLDHGTN